MHRIFYRYKRATDMMKSRNSYTKNKESVRRGKSLNDIGARKGTVASVQIVG